MDISLHLTRIKFYSGRTVSASALEVSPSTVVVFVGPNNSGKSLALREIESLCRGQNEIRRVIENIEVEFPQTPDEALEWIQPFRANPPESQSEAPEYWWIGYHTFRQNEPYRHYQLPLNDIKSNVQNRHNLPNLYANLVQPYTMRLDGRTRFLLSDPKQTGDLLLPPQNHLAALFRDDAARERVRKLTSEAFGLHFVIDPTAMTQFRIRMSEREPANKTEEQALDETARRFHHRAKLISELSDGVQAFTGLISAVMSLQHRIILIDEPEAFLHPPLARRLGDDLASLTNARGASLVVATHSADFVMGCIEGTANTTIIRLTYENGNATARVLQAGELKDLMLDPLLRSTGALRGLFHRAVVVTESDTDRAFYDEINRRLRDDRRGIDDALFVNAQNWQTIKRVIHPLRRLGIPAAGVMDLDVLSGGATDWNHILDAFGVIGNERTEIENLQHVCTTHLNSCPPVSAHDRTRIYKVQGVDSIPEPGRAEVKRLIDRLSEYGLFIVHVGELERWLANMNITGRKSEWLTSIFTALGSDPATSTYVHAGSGDVWEFIQKIARWVGDPARKGIP